MRLFLAFIGLVAIVAVALTMFSGGFTKSTPITVTSTRAGLVMEPNAKVKLRGVQVGRVESLDKPTVGGGQGLACIIAAFLADA